MKIQFKVCFYALLSLAINLSYSQVGFDLAQEIQADFVHQFWSINHGDLDGDGDIDVVLGHHVFLNNGNGSLIESKGAISTTTLPRSSSIGDVDGDGDLDVLIKPEGVIFINDGNAKFTSYETPIENYYKIKEGEFLDLDVDGDLDCLIYDDNGGPHAFFNDGNGNFDEVETNIFPETYSAWFRIYVEDINDDGLEDILVNGLVSSRSPFLKILINNGGFSFTEHEISFATFGGSLKVGDLNNDGNKDIVISGEDADGYGQTEVLINDGNFNFELKTNDIIDLREGNIELIDVDLDQDLDVVISGVNNLSSQRNKPKTSLYLNNGNADFTEEPTVFEKVRYSDRGISKIDVDSDGDDDLIIAGIVESSEFYGNLYINDGNGNFTKIGTSPFPDLENTTTATGDINGDGWDDVITMGADYGPNNVVSTQCQIFINDQNDNFISNQSFHGAQLGDLKLFDFDSDGDLDLILLGNQKGDSGPGYSNPLYSGIVSKLYLNDGNGNFEESASSPFTPLWYCSIEVLDFDNDNDDDLVIIGLNSSYDPITSIYRNDGSGEFTLIESEIPNFGIGDIESGDLDGDSDLDLVISGFSSVGDAGDRTTKIYYNDGDGQFEDSNLQLTGFGRGSISIGDTDGDGDLDFIQSGGTTRFGDSELLPLNSYTFHYRNNGNGTFNRELINDIGSLLKCSAQLADIDNDNDLDYVITGELDSQFCSFLDCKRSKIYLNNGFGDFFEVVTTIEPTDFGSLSAFDFDNDGLIDILLSGNTDLTKGRSRLYRNSTITDNLPLVNSSVEDKILNKGFGSTSLNLLDIFIDKIGSGFSYITRINDSRIITADYENDNLILIEAELAGKTDVIITAQDEYGSVVSNKFSVKVNTIPSINDAIQDQVYTQGFVSSTIDISSRYSDPDGDELTYTIEVSDESIVNANYVDGILTINEGVITGETTVSITIDDGNTGIILDEFSVKVEKPLSIDTDRSLLVYPNPSPQNFTLMGSGFSNVDVKSIDGKQVNYSLIERGDEVVVQFNEEYKGILILKVEIEDQKIIRKLIKY